MLSSLTYSWLEAYILYSVKTKANIFYTSLNNADNSPLGGQLKNVEVNVEMIDELHKYVYKNRVEKSLELFTDGIHTRNLHNIQLTSATCARAYVSQRAE